MGVFSDKLSALRRLKSWIKAENYFNGKLIASAAVAILAILSLSAAVLIVSIRDHRNDSLRAKTLELARIANQIENDLANLEASHRGFLLSGNEKYAAPLDDALERIEPSLKELVNRSAHPEIDQARTEKIRVLVKQWLTSVAMPQLERRRNAAGEQDAVTSEIEASGLGRSYIDEAKKTLDAIQKEADQTLRNAGAGQIGSGPAYELLIYIPKLESSLAEMKKAVWGYLLTGSNASLTAYGRAISEFEAISGHLSVALTEDKAQKEALSQIRAVVDKWQREIARPEIEARKAGRDGSELFASGNGSEVLEKAAQDLERFEKLESGKFEQVTLHTRWARIGKVAVLGFVCLVAIGVIVASSCYSFVAYSRHLRKIESAEAKTRSIIETTPDGVVTLNAQGTILSMNPSAERMFAQPTGSMIGKNISLLIPQRLFIHDMAKLGRGSMMAVGQRQGYYSFPIEISLNEMSVGTQTSYVALIRDVSERKRSEDTLKNIGLGVSSSTGEEFIRSLVKQLSKALQTDYAFIVQITRKGVQVTHSLILAEHGQIRNRQDYSITETACEDVLKKGMRAVPKAVLETYPNDQILAELKAESFLALPLTDHKGNTAGVIGIIDGKPTEDMTIAESTLRIFGARAGAELERKRFEEDLAAEKERLAVTLRSIGDGVITIDIEGRVALLNSVAETYTGWKQGQAQGRPLTDIFHLLHDRTRQPLTDAIERLIETGSAVGLEGDAIVVAVDGSERMIESSAAPIRDRNNRRVGVVLVFRDVTERIKIEEERRKAEKLESLGVAAGGIAHDFNNLLTSIIGNLSLALISLRPEEGIAERLTSAKKSSIRAQELAQQLLTFARGGAPIKKSAAISQLLKDTVSFTLRGTSTRSEYDFAPDLWTAEIDAGQISQAVGNIVRNAQQAMSCGGTVSVLCQNVQVGKAEANVAGINPGNYVQIAIQDTGVGISEENLEKIFDPYYSTKNGASGLGLATAYSIVKQHAGQITVDSTPDVGSTFTILLPADNLTFATFEPATESPVPAEANNQPRTNKILILDDEEDICALVTHALTPMGFKVTETNDALTAIRVFEDAVRTGEKFDAVISDLTIPGSMGGQDAVKKLREIDPSIRAIVSSGYAMDPVMSNYRQYGFCACLAKPYEISALCDLVSKVVSGGEGLVSVHEFEQQAAEPA